LNLELKKTLEIIEDVKKNNLTTLDLSGLGLEIIPKEVFELTGLQSLYLHSNHLSILPEEIGVLVNLKELKCQFNKLTSLPAEIGFLKKLDQLILHDNNLAELPIEIKNLKNLRVLLLHYNQLSIIPNETRYVRNLRILSLHNNQLSSLPDGIEHLANLEELTIQENNLTFLPSAIGNLLNLKNLSIGQNSLKKLPSEIGNLTNLESLSLYLNQIKELPPEIGKLTNLRNLYLAQNQINELPNEIGRLTNLEILYLSYNLLDRLPVKMGDLENLKKLELSNNQLTNLPPEIGKLTKLITLNLNQNKLEFLPSEIGDLVNLEEISLDKNNIKLFPEEIGKNKNLKRISIRNNQLRNLPLNIVDLPHLQELDLAENPLLTPPTEIIQQGINAIRNYITQIKEGGVDNIYEAKLLIVGQGDVGKSFLRSRLIHDCIPDSKTTEGIDIEQWYITTQNTDRFRVNFWDFGGQEIYHATHQFFLTKRSLYLFVWEARTDDDLINFDYWLNIIKLLSNNSPVIIIMNKEDERTKAIDEKTIKDKFLNVIGFYKASALEGTGCDVLRQRIANEIVKLPHIGDEVPKVWINIREKLEGLEKNYISYDEYIEICNSCGLDKERSDYLSSYYHDLGVLLHFSDNPILRETVFLIPEWATRAVYKILDTKGIADNHGEFKYADLDVYWKDYPRDKYPVLLELMKKFELCFELAWLKKYIVPERLPAEKPWFEWDYENNLKFEYHYDFMPVGIITRFVARMHHRLKENLYWKNGAILEWDKAEALIISERISRKIRIWIKGESPKTLLSIIRQDIDQIHNTLNKPTVKEMLPCICTECQITNETYFHLFTDLMRAVGKGKKTTECKKSYENVEIFQILRESLKTPDEEDEERESKTIMINDAYFYPNSNPKFVDL
jgi:small GTP-binding protein